MKESPADLSIRETPEERFTRLATARTNSALKRIRIIGNLASPNYKYTVDQVAKILTALREEVDDLEKRFSRKNRKEQNFSL